MIEKLTGHRKTNSRGAIIYPPSSLDICEKVNEIIDFLNSDSVVKVTEKDCCPVGSEDERIRKGLIAIITDFESLYLQENYSLSREDILAWLEKQGEHANFRNKIQIGDKVTRNEDGVLVNLSQLKRVAKKDEKQGEQKTIKASYTTIVETGNGGVNAVVKRELSTDKCYGEQKPAWSEEELCIINGIIGYLCTHDSCELEGFDKWYDFLKSLKDRVQPKQDWSEEDEKHIMAIDLAVNRCLGKWHCCGEKCPISEHNPWLKSLKERYTWKPSDEQMNLLREVQQALLGKDCHNRFVNFMYELKRLREK